MIELIAICIDLYFEILQNFNSKVKCVATRLFLENGSTFLIMSEELLFSVFIILQFLLKFIKDTI